MAITASLVQSNSLKQVYLLTGDGASLTTTIPSATLLTNSAGGPLRGALSGEYASLAAMKKVFGEGSVRMWLRPQSREWPAGVSVALDGVTPTKPAVAVTATVAPAAAATAYLDVEFVHSVVK